MNLSRSLVAVLFFAMTTVILAALSLSVSSAEEEKVKKEYIFAVIPQGPPESMHRKWLPFVDRLSRDTGLVLKLKVYENISDFEEDIIEGKVDFAYMNPIQEVMAWHARGYIPLVRGKKLISGCIFTKKDSLIKEPHDLEGKEIALLGSKNVCSIVIRHDLQALNVTPRYVGSTSNVYKNVEIGETAAGGTLDIVFDSNSSEKNQEFHTIYTTEPLCPHPISAHPSIEPGVTQLLVDTVLKHPEDKDLQVLLERIGMQDPVAADYERDYKPLEQRLSRTER